MIALIRKVTMLLSVPLLLLLSLLCLRYSKSLPLYEICFPRNGVSKCTNVKRLEEVGFASISQNIEEIYMEDITKVPPLFDLNNLETVGISSSNISLHPECLQNVSSVRKILLTRNVELHIKSASLHRLSVKTINITLNSLIDLEDVSFLHLPTLEIVRINYNQLKVWNPDAFYKTPNVRVLELMSNKLISLPAEAFRNLANLQEIELAGNELEELDEDTFKGLNSLVRLNLQKNRLTILPANLFAPYPFRYSNGSVTYRKKPMENVIFESNYLQFIPQRLLNDLPENVNLNVALNPWKCNCYFKLMRWAKSNGASMVTKNFHFPICIAAEGTCVEMLNRNLFTKYFQLCTTCRKPPPHI